MAIEERLSSSDEAQDKAQTPSQLPLPNDETVFCWVGSVQLQKHCRWSAPLTKKTNKYIKIKTLMLFILFVVGLCPIEL